MKNVRLKSALHPLQIQDRLKYEPEILEIHINEKDLLEPENIVRSVRELKAKGIKVYLHHPTKYQGQSLDINSSSQELRDFYDWSCKELAMICRQEGVKCVVHCHYSNSESSQNTDRASRVALRKRVEQILPVAEGNFLWEDSTRGIFSAENSFLLHEIIKPLNLLLTIDVSHSFIALKGNNEKLKRHLECYYSFTQYYHLVDSNGVYHDGLPLGKGKD